MKGLKSRSLDEVAIIYISAITLIIISYMLLAGIEKNKENIQENLVFISDLTECMTELDQRMDSMEGRPEISISYGTVITTEDEIIIQEEEKDGE